MTYLDDDEMWGAQKANDSKTGGDSRTDGVTRTTPLTNPWWELELKEPAVIEKLVLWNRTDGNQGPRLAGVRVLFLNDRRQVLWTRTYSQAPSPQVETETPRHSDKLTADDLKAIEQSGVVKTKSALSTLVEAWIRGAKVVEPAAPVAAASPATRRLAGGFSAEAATPQRSSGPAPVAVVPENHWLVRFGADGYVVGELKSWSSDGLTVSIRIGSETRSITIPTRLITEVVSRDLLLKNERLDRTQVAADADTVFAKAEGNALQAVQGTVRGIEGESLQFEFQGKVRGIRLARLAALVRARSDAADQKTYGLFSLDNGMKVPGTIAGLNADRISIELPWASPLDVEKSQVRSVLVRHGKALSLVDLEPASVQYTPYLDRVLPIQKNASLTGKPLQVADKRFETGLCAHSGTVMTWNLGGAYESLRLQAGLQHDDGARGQAILRLKADGAVLSEKPLTAAAQPELIEILLTGKSELVVEVDYGDGLDIGDHVVLGEPVLVRTAAP